MESTLLFGVPELLCILIMVVVTKLYTCANIHRTLHRKGGSILCKTFFFNLSTMPGIMLSEAKAMVDRYHPRAQCVKAWM